MTAEAAASGPSDEPVVYEQPLNERMRTFLRLDFLYNQALYHNSQPSQWGSRAAVSSLLDILAITLRGDLRSDVLKELERHLATLAELQHRPGIDLPRLQALLANLARLRNELSGAGTGWLATLRDSEFLASIKHRSAIPGGTCEFDLPDYSFWLSLAPEARTQTFARWLGLLRPLCDAIAELLWLTRQNGKVREETARSGVFNITFDRDTPYQLLRITLPPGSKLYPEISGSHYRCSMRFLEWSGLETRAKQAEEDIAFTLTCCP
ncbi:MAG TPA: cell division protein ZapD [Steroidobacteraceae bacterium]|nr:cell division protein ZapD [Steroidobacteraceae bacterium]